MLRKILEVCEYSTNWPEQYIFDFREALLTILDPEDDNVLTEKTRDIGFVVVRGPSLLTISPVDGSEIIDNPFANQEE